MVDLSAQGISKGNLPTAPAAPTLTLAGTQAAADNKSEAALGQSTREEAKLPAPSLAIEPVCTRPAVAGTKVLVQVVGMTQVVSVSGTSTPASRMLEDSCLSDEHAPHVKFLQI